MDAVRLDDGQIERYSRQIVLPEIGATGQSRLLDAQVAVLGNGAAAGAIIAQFAAAGVGRIVAPPALHAHADPADATQLAATDASSGDAEALVTVQPVTELTPPIEPLTLWLQDGRIGATPCARCATRALPPAPPCPPELTFARDALLGALLATEALKQIVGIETTLAGHALTYDPTTADVTVTALTPDPTCATCASGQER